MLAVKLYWRTFTGLSQIHLIAQKKILFTENATRYCRNDSTWEKTNFDKCLHISNDTELHDFVPSIELPTIIYGIGYVLSLSSLTLALIVFLHLK